MRSWIRKIVAVGIALLLLTIDPSFAGEVPDSIRVITYNVQFLPSPADLRNKRGEPEYRATRIAQEIGKFDIIALQEVFHTRWKEHIIAAVRAAWDGELHVFESPKAEGHFTTGGCLILSRYPFVETNSMVYRNFSTPADYGLVADGLAAKGVIHARVSLGGGDGDGAGNPIDVFVTHIEAAARDLRPLQYAEMAEFIGRTSDPAIPMLLLGDLNTNGNPMHWDDPKSQYSLLMGELNRVRPSGISDVWRKLENKNPGGTTEQDPLALGNRIDYIIQSSGNRGGLDIRARSIRVEVYSDPKLFALSDHNAVIADFEVTP